MKQYHPGCFGSPLCHGETGLPCTKCPYQAECGVKADQVAEQLRRVYRIEDAFTATRKIVKRPAVTRMSITPVNATTALASNQQLRDRIDAETLPRTGDGAAMPMTGPFTVPKKGQELYDNLVRKGIDLKRSVAMGSNPFDIQPPKHMQVLMALLLAGGFSRAQGKQSLVNDLGWAEASASSNVSSAVAVMVMMGAATEQGDRVMPVTV